MPLPPISSANSQKGVQEVISVGIGLNTLAEAGLVAPAILEALTVLGFPFPPKGHPAAISWTASAQGKDVAAEVPPPAQIPTALPPLLAKLACNEHLRMLVLCTTETVAPLEEQIALRGKLAGITATSSSTAEKAWPGVVKCLIGNPCALLPQLEHQTLSETVGSNLMVVLLGCDRLLQEEGEALHKLLMALARPQQTSLVAGAWTPSMEQLSRQLLTQPVFIRQDIPDMNSHLPVRFSQDVAHRGDSDDVGPEKPPSRLAHVSYSSKTNGYIIRGANKPGLFQCTSKAAGSVERARMIADHLCEMLNAGASADDVKARKKEILSSDSVLPDMQTLDIAKNASVAGLAAVPFEPRSMVEDEANAVLSTLQQEHAGMLAKYVANIVCRSSNREFRQAVLELLPNKRKATGAFRDTAEASRVDDEEDMQQPIIQDRIATLLTSSGKLSVSGAANVASQVLPVSGCRSMWLSDEEDSAEE